MGNAWKNSRKHKDDQAKLIVFSRQCTITEKMNGLNEEVKRELGVETIITEQEYELFEW